MAEPSLKTRMKNAMLAVAGNEAKQQGAISEAMGYLMGSGKDEAAAALAMSWSKLFPDTPLPERMVEVMGGGGEDLFGGDYS